MIIREHEKYPDMRVIYDRLGRASPVSRILGHLVEALLAGRLEYVFPWDDFRCPLTALDPVGLTAPPSVEASTGLFLFGSTRTEMVGATIQMPHSWKESSDIIPHVQWQKTTSEAGEVHWQLEYKWAPLDGVMDAEWTVLSESKLEIGHDDTADKYAVSSFGPIVTSAPFPETGHVINDVLIMRLSRIGNSAEDTYGDDVRVLEFDVRYQADGIGSIEQLYKGSVESLW